jgi:MFS family permease
MTMERNLQSSGHAPGSSGHRARTLWLCGALHAFTHIYHVALLPLYLLIQRDLRLTSVEQATVLMTVMMVAYFVPAYGIGILTDRISRKALLGAGLIINSIGFIGLSYASNYTSALFFVALSGFGGSFFHPAATALIARLFPIGTGKALGLLGIGASAGFFVGPLYSGWRAAVTGNWRTPVFELGLFGFIAALLFFWLATEDAAPRRHASSTTPSTRLFPTGSLWLIFIATAVAFSFRDFAGSCTATLSSLFLQKGHGFELGKTGFALSTIYLASAISNPLFGGLSDRGRIRWITVVISAAAVLMAILPRAPVWAIIPTLLLYGFFFMASYPMVEAALMEAVHDSVRGRVFGLFITIGGLVGNLAHWQAGDWVKRLAARASSPESYHTYYLWLAGLLLVSLAGLPCLHALRKREEQLEPSMIKSHSARL